MKKQNSIRIISGFLKGNFIKFSHSINLRPTKDIIKESLFSILNVNNFYCLDLFSGTGSLGFESLSRGASYVTFVENNKKYFNIIKKNIRRFSLSNLKCINSSYIDFLKCNKDFFDLIFIDPPFKYFSILKNIVLNCLKFLKKGGYIFLESSKKIYFKEIKTLKFGKKGKVFYYLLNNSN